MPATIDIGINTLGSSIRRVRIGLRLTQQELAEITGVPVDDIDLFENSLPVCLDSRRKVLKSLWAIKHRQETI